MSMSMDEAASIVNKDPREWTGIVDGLKEELSEALDELSDVTNELREARAENRRLRALITGGES